MALIHTTSPLFVYFSITVILLADASWVQNLAAPEEPGPSCLLLLQPYSISPRKPDSLVSVAAGFTEGVRLEMPQSVDLSLLLMCDLLTVYFVA